MEIVIRNLISNAIKFTHVGGYIEIKAYKEAKKLTISVSDNGIGIAKENMKKLFGEELGFSTIGTQSESGTGLGLLLCKDYTEKNGGYMSMHSEQGKGSTFFLYFPMQS